MKEGIDQKEKIKEDTVALLIEHDPSGKNVENYSRFFEKCVNGCIAYFEKKLIKFKENGLDDKDARLALFKTLHEKETDLKMVSNVSPNPAYLINETPLSNHVMEFVLSAILQTEDIMLAMKADTKANKKMETHRCLITAPCELNYTNGEKEHVVFVALSGYASNDEHDPLFQLHKKMKFVIDNLHYTNPQHEEFHFRYIENSSRRYDILLQQMNAIISRNEAADIFQKKETSLSKIASKGCAEKKIFSEIAKQLIEIDQTLVQKMFLAGMTNVCMPGLLYLEKPGTIEELQSRSKETAHSKKYKKEQGKLYQCKISLDATKIKIAKHKNDLSKNLTKKQKQKVDTELEKSYEKLRVLKETKKQYKQELLSAMQGANADEAKAALTDNVIYIPTKDNPSQFWPCWKIPACSNCQEHKIPYLGILYQSAQNYMPIFSNTMPKSPRGSGSSSASMMQSPVKSGPSKAPSTPVKSVNPQESLFTPSTPSSFFVSPVKKISPAQVMLPKRKAEETSEGESSKRRKKILDFT